MQKSRHPRRSVTARSFSRAFEQLELRRHLDATYHPLAASNFTQGWTDTALITTNNNWNSVPSIIGYTGVGTASGVDPRTITGSGATVSVIANNVNPNGSTSGAVYEFELANPTIGMVGSNSAGSPYIQIHLDTSSVSSVDISYNVRDLESTADNAIQRVALQYRIGTSGNWTNVEAGYVADATTISTATQVTPVNVTLPVDVANQPLVQVRIISGNAAGNDEAIGIDDIVIRPTPVIQPPGNFQLDATRLFVDENAGNAIVTVTRQGGTGGSVSVDYSTADLTALNGIDFNAVSGTLNFADGQSTADITIPLTNDALDELQESFTVTLSNPTGGAGLNPTVSRDITILDADGQKLSAGPLEQDWSNVDLLTTGDDWSLVSNITGYSSDADRLLNIFDVIANQNNPAGQSSGGVAEFDGIPNPTIAIQGSNAAPQPQLLLDVNTTDITTATVSFNAIDLDSSADNAAQSISVGYRIGSSGDFQEIFFAEDVTEAGAAGLTTPISFTLPESVLGQDLVQIRIVTNNATGNDEWVGIDDIRVATEGTVLPPPTMTSTYAFETEEAMTLDFSADVSASLSASDITIQNTTTGATLAPEDFTLTSTSTSTTSAVIRFAAPLANGRYTLTIAADSVSALGGQTNPAALTAQWFVLSGDLDRSGTVEFNDLLILAQNYGRAGQTFSQGNVDLSVDGVVGFNDLLKLAQNFGTTLLVNAANTAAAAPAVANAGTSKRRNVAQVIT